MREFHQLFPSTNWLKSDQGQTNTLHNVIAGNHVFRETVPLDVSNKEWKEIFRDDGPAGHMHREWRQGEEGCF